MHYTASPLSDRKLKPRVGRLWSRAAAAHPVVSPLSQASVRRLVGVRAAARVAARNLSDGPVVFSDRAN